MERYIKFRQHSWDTTQFNEATKNNETLYLLPQDDLLALGTHLFYKDAFKGVAYNQSNGVITFSKYDGTTASIDLPTEMIFDGRSFYHHASKQLVMIFSNYDAGVTSEMIATDIENATALYTNGYVAIDFEDLANKILLKVGELETKLTDGTVQVKKAEIAIYDNNNQIIHETYVKISDYNIKMAEIADEKLNRSGTQVMLGNFNMNNNDILDVSKLDHYSFKVGVLDTDTIKLDMMNTLFNLGAVTKESEETWKQAYARVIADKFDEYLKVVNEVNNFSQLHDGDITLPQEDHLIFFNYTTSMWENRLLSETQVPTLQQSKIDGLVNALNTINDKLDAVEGAYVLRGTINVATDDMTAALLTNQIYTLLTRTPELGDVLKDNQGGEWYFDNTTWRFMGQAYINLANYYETGVADITFAPIVHTHVEADITDLDKYTKLETDTKVNLKANQTYVQPHIESTENPHGVTKAQIALGNVDNTSDLDKPLSTAIIAELNNKLEEANLTPYAKIENVPLLDGTGKINDIYMKESYNDAYTGYGTFDTTDPLDPILLDLYPPDQWDTGLDQPIAEAVAYEKRANVVYVTKNVTENALYRYSETATQFAKLMPSVIGLGTTQGTGYDGAEGQDNRDRIIVIENDYITQSDLDEVTINAINDITDVEIVNPTTRQVLAWNDTTSKWNNKTLSKTDVALDSVQNYAIATELEAEAGTANDKYMTPLRTNQAIQALAPDPDLTTYDTHLADTTTHFIKTDVSQTDVGLSNVDNTSDANKPVSTAQQTALDLKANTASPTFTGTVSGVTKTHVGLGDVDNTSDAGKPVSTAQQTAFDAKADLADGKVPLNQLPDTAKQQSYVRTTIALRDAITGLLQGDTCFVTDDGQKFIWSGSLWILMSDTNWENVNLAWANIIDKPATFAPTIGSTSTTAVAGNDARLTNSRPASDVYAWAKASVKPSYSASEIGGLGASYRWLTDTYITTWNGKENAFTKNTAFNKNFGTATNTLIHGNDARLSNARTPVAHNQAWSTITSQPATATRWPTWSEVTSKPTTFAPSAHNHTLANITDSGNIASINKNNSTANYLRGDGAWVTPPNTNTTYALISEVAIRAGTETTARSISASRISHKFRVVAALPASPVAGVFYFVEE